MLDAVKCQTACARSQEAQHSLLLLLLFASLASHARSLAQALVGSLVRYSCSCTVVETLVAWRQQIAR